MSFSTPQIPFEPIANEKAVVLGPAVRFSILTDRLIRMEYNPKGVFEDRPSQTFWFRKQPVPYFSTSVHEKTVVIQTTALNLVYTPTPEGFSRDTLQITILSTGKIWKFGDDDPQNLRGTGRTLDGVDGEIDLERGLLSRSGWAVMDDSQSLVFNKNGWLESRSEHAGIESLDLYFFGYARDYTECLRDYFKISGSVPMVPRWILGNWWSRYWEYTQQDLTDLMLEFKRREVPLSVCIIDMDWHITKTGNASSGWTGYTWNRDLFPQPQAFLSLLREEMRLHIGMNLHPADGVWPHEEMYPQMAEKMGIDPQSGLPVNFDIADPEFAKNYFEILHHPYEDQGVDFWWMDWQQGARITHSKNELAKKLDPLWWLNHLHYYDLGRGGKNRAFIFSRWGGLGNHRYPIGFSGDSVVSWKSLQFQPTFTATAANVGFGWWSHDIGGHMIGIEDSELYTRWVQFGVFSPILRLHCTKNPYQDRAPWSFGEDTFQVVRHAMRLRHLLIPYIYSNAWRFSRTGVPLSTPMYYAHPEKKEAYECKDQYFFGDQLLAAPFVTPRNEETNLSRSSVWFPAGDWYDLFSGEKFEGEGWKAVYGDINTIPIFSRAGGIVPLAKDPIQNGVDLPTAFTVKIFPGADGRFNLFEDDGESGDYLQGVFCETILSQEWSGSKQTFRIQPPSGQTEFLPPTRIFDLIFHGIHMPDSLLIKVDGKEVLPGIRYLAGEKRLLLSGIELTTSQGLEVILFVSTGLLASEPDRRTDKMRQRLRVFRLPSRDKQRIDQDIPNILKDSERLGSFANLLSDSQLAALHNALV